MRVKWLCKLSTHDIIVYTYAYTDPTSITHTPTVHGRESADIQTSTDLQSLQTASLTIVHSPTVYQRESSHMRTQTSTSIYSQSSQIGHLSTSTEGKHICAFACDGTDIINL